MLIRNGRVFDGTGNPWFPPDIAVRPARADEIAKMRDLVRQALREGAVGLSAGLEYEPGRWSTTEEVVELAKELPAVDGIYISHERSEGTDPLWYVPSQDGPVAPTLFDAVQETIDIGERTGARVVASHLKAKGEHYWGSSAAAVSLIQRARDRGVDVWADQYPYSTAKQVWVATSPTVALPFRVMGRQRTRDSTAASRGRFATMRSTEATSASWRKPRNVAFRSIASR